MNLSSLVFSCGGNLFFGRDTFTSESDAEEFERRKKKDGYNTYKIINRLYNTHIIFYNKKEINVH